MLSRGASLSSVVRGTDLGYPDTIRSRGGTNGALAAPPLPKHGRPHLSSTDFPCKKTNRLLPHKLPGFIRSESLLALVPVLQRYCSELHYNHASGLSLGMPVPCSGFVLWVIAYPEATCMHIV